MRGFFAGCEAGSQMRSIVYDAYKGAGVSVDADHTEQVRGGGLSLQQAAYDTGFTKNGCACKRPTNPPARPLTHPTNRPPASPVTLTSEVAASSA